MEPVYAVVLQDAKMSKDGIHDVVLVQDIVKKTIDWVDANPSAEREEYDAKKKEIEEVWRPIITAAYGAGGGGAAQGGMGGMPDMGNFAGGRNSATETERRSRTGSRTTCPREAIAHCCSGSADMSNE